MVKEIESKENKTLENKTARLLLLTRETSAEDVFIPPRIPSKSGIFSIFGKKPLQPKAIVIPDTNTIHYYQGDQNRQFAIDLATTYESICTYGEFTIQEIE